MSKELKNIYKELKQEYSTGESLLNKKLNDLYVQKNLQKTKKMSVYIDVPWKKLPKKQKIAKINVYLLDNLPEYKGNIESFTYKNLMYNMKDGKVKNMDYQKKL